MTRSGLLHESVSDGATPFRLWDTYRRLACAIKGSHANSSRGDPLLNRELRASSATVACLTGEACSWEGMTRHPARLDDLYSSGLAAPRN